MTGTLGSRIAHNKPPTDGASVALISAVDPYPSDAGKKVVLAGFVEYLAERFGSENVHYLMVGGVTGEDDFPVRLHRLPKPSTAVALGNVLTRTATGRASLQESLLRSPEVRTAIHEILGRLRPSLEIYDTVRMAQYARPDTSARQICYLDDLFSRRYGTMLDAVKRFPDVEFQPLNSFADHVPRFLRPLADHRASQRLLLQFEQRLVRRSEDQTARRFATSLLMNEQEAHLLRERSGTDSVRIQAIPPLIVPPSSPARAHHGAPDFVFIGQLSMPHNEDGLRAFVANVWPRVLAESPQAHLTVVGRNARPTLVRELAQHGDTVTMAGFVPDLSDLLARSAALISPARFGSGIKLKVIDALGAGVPVVGTTSGVEGVVPGASGGVLVADDDRAFAEAMLSTIEVSRNAELSAGASEHFAKRYSRTAVFAAYDSVFGSG